LDEEPEPQTQDPIPRTGFENRKAMLSDCENQKCVGSEGYFIRVLDTDKQEIALGSEMRLLKGKF
jgi:hypothetical protein